LGSGGRDKRQGGQQHRQNTVIPKHLPFSLSAL
jgi:hypothetical protein